jgi:cell wall-associated NlpC family hydrolase
MSHVKHHAGSWRVIMQLWKKGLFVGLFSSLLFEQQAVEAAVGLRIPEVKRLESPVQRATDVRPQPIASERESEAEALQEGVVSRHLGEKEWEVEQRERGREAQDGQQAGGARLSSRGDLPPRAEARSQGVSNAAPTLMQGAGVRAPLGQRVSQKAMRYQGVPYLYGGTTPQGFDCSGLIQYVYKQDGVDLPRTTHQQWSAGTRVNRQDLQPGDLVFFACGGQATSHSGLYLGNGKFIHADQSKGVRVDDLNRDYWAGVFQGGVRVVF